MGCNLRGMLLHDVEVEASVNSLVAASTIENSPSLNYGNIQQRRKGLESRTFIFSCLKKINPGAHVIQNRMFFGPSKTFICFTCISAVAVNGESPLFP